MPVNIETNKYSEKTDGGWKDDDGFIVPTEAGQGPRANPLNSNYPTGPEVGTRLPDVRCLDVDGKPVDLHALRAGRPAILQFNRSAVW